MTVIAESEKDEFITFLESLPQDKISLLIEWFRMYIEVQNDVQRDIMNKALDEFLGSGWHKVGSYKYPVVITRKTIKTHEGEVGE